SAIAQTTEFTNTNSSDSSPAPNHRNATGSSAMAGSGLSAAAKVCSVSRAQIDTNASMLRATAMTSPMPMAISKFLSVAQVLLMSVKSRIPPISEPMTLSSDGTIIGDTPEIFTAASQKTSRAMTTTMRRQLNRGNFITSPPREPDYLRAAPGSDDEARRFPADHASRRMDYRRR